MYEFEDNTMEEILQSSHANQRPVIHTASVVSIRISLTYASDCSVCLLLSNPSHHTTARPIIPSHAWLFMHFLTSN